MWSGNPKKLETIRLKECREMCPFDEYLKIVKPNLPTDDEMMCLYKNLKPLDIKKILTTDTNALED